MNDKYQEKVTMGLSGAATPRPDYRPTIAEVLEKDSAQNACRQSLFDSLVSRIHRAEAASYEAARLQRLAQLFDKHPEVREMFELIRDLGIL